MLILKNHILLILKVYQKNTRIYQTDDTRFTEELR